MTTRRLVAAGAAVTVTAGAMIMLIALVAAPGRWWQGYVSEAGTAGQPDAVPYRWGLIVLAVGVALLALALRLGPLVSGSLLTAAVLAGTSGAVPCSNMCPLPPYEPTTVADVVHTAASILGMLLLAGAMAAVPLARPGAAMRRLALAGLVPIVPLGAALGLTMLIVGRGTLGAILERLTLVVAVCWLVGTALLTALSPADRADSAGRPVRAGRPV